MIGNPAKLKLAPVDEAVPTVVHTPTSRSKSGGGPKLSSSGSYTGGGARELGRYRLVASLGTGGMARVYLALDASDVEQPEQLTVVKVLRSELADDPRFIEMFEQEARLATRMDHANVVRTYDVGVEGGRHVLTMEYLEGQPLSRVMAHAREKPQDVPLPVLVKVLADTLDGLQYAHDLTDDAGAELNIVHRDISPQNVFVTYDGAAKVLDFGIAKTSQTSQLTQTGVIKGKVGYIAPEQVLGRSAAHAVDRRADVFAIGVMLWEAITRKRFVDRGVDDFITLARRGAGDEPKVLEADPTAPPELAAICEKAKAHEAPDRYASAKEMRDALLGWARDHGDPNPAAVAAVMDKLFGEHRERLKRTVEKQIAALTSGKGAYEALVDLHTEAPVTPPFGTRAPHDSLAETEVRKTVAPPAPKTTVRLFIAVAVASFAGLTWFALRPAPKPTTIVVTAPATAVAPAPPGSISVQVVATPREAKLTLDGEPLSNPWSAQRAISHDPHTLKLEAPGYATETRTLKLDENVSLILELAKLDAGAAPGVRPNAPARPGQSGAPATSAAPVETAAPAASAAPTAAPSATAPSGHALDWNDPWKR